ncbi:hypothetical protein GQ54DRAFT_287883 [Martensiomyces pterosporus]|nr:hypothetical protein GQ54DRAFT_287883 [Martensiomyces pterosporus]
MADESAEHSDALDTTPLSVSFRDTAFMKFVNEANSRDGSTPYSSNRDKSLGTRAAARQQQDTPRRYPQSVGRQPPTKTPKHLPSTQHGMQPESVTSHNENSMDTNDDDDDDDEWDELDSIELDSQTMRQLEETEERFYATQQSLIPSRTLLSQEFAETKSQASGHRSKIAADQDARNSRTVPAARVRSVPVTPTTGRPPYSPGSSTARFGGIEHSANVSNQPIDTLSASQRPTQQLQRQSRRVTYTQQTSNASRSKVNLYSRLAQHIPPRPNNSSSWSQRPPLGNQTKTAPAQHSQAPYRHSPPQNQQRQQMPAQPHSSASAQFSPGASTLTPPGKPLPQLHTAGANAGPPLPLLSTQPGVAQVLEELARIKGENEQMRLETEQLRSQLYTKEGEVKIVRENLTRTEIENTHLQEQLANQISSTAAAQRQAEQQLQAEIERLKTELFFQEQEAQIASMSKTQQARSSGISSAGASNGARPASGVSGGERTGGSDSPSDSNGVAYPSINDFKSVPKLPARSVATDPAVRLQAAQSRDQSQGSDKSDAANSELLAMLTDISQASNTGFGSLVSLSVLLSKAVQSTTTERVAEFHSWACSILCGDVPLSSSYEQLNAVAQLLLRAVNGLAEFRSIWLLGNAAAAVNADGPSDADAHTGAGYLRTSQLAAAVGTSLQNALAAGSKAAAEGHGGDTCGAAIASLCKLFARLIALQPAASLDSGVWRDFDPCSLGRFLTPAFSIAGLLGVLELVTTLVQASTVSWGYLHSNPSKFESLLLAIMKRLRVAFAENEPHMLDGERALLVLIASAIVTHEEDTHALINAMPRFARTMVQAFLDEHAVLVSEYPCAGSKRRVQVFFEYVKCLNVVLSEVSDVVALLGGDNSPAFFGFVAACTRMTFGEGAFGEFEAIREQAADLLAYVVTEDQALSIHSL